MTAKKKPQEPAAALPQWAIDKLTDRERRFVEEYLIDLNGRQAYIRAGFANTHTNKNSAQVGGSRLLAHPAVSEVIEKLASERGTARVWIFDRLCALAAGDISKHGRIVSVKDDAGKFKSQRVEWFDHDKLSPEDLLCISEMSETITEFGNTIKVRLEDRQAAFAKLMKILRMDIDRTEISGPNGGPVEVTDPADEVRRELELIAKRREEVKRKA